MDCIIQSPDIRRAIAIAAVALAVHAWHAETAMAQAPDDDPAQIATEVDPNNPRIRLGHCNTEFNTYYTNRFMESTDQAHEFGAAIYIKPEVLKKYAGCSISSIHFALWDEVGEYYNVFVAEELGDIYTPVHPVSQALVPKGHFHTGWNAASIPPVTITGNKGLYIGWLSAVDAEHAMEGYFTLDRRRGELVTDGNWYMAGSGRWQVIKKEINLNLMIRAYADGDNAPLTDVGIGNMDGADVIWQSSPTSYKMLVTNYGTDTISTMDVEVMSDGQIFSQKQIGDIAIGHNGHMTLTVDDVEFPDAGNHNISVRVTALNGLPDSDMSDNSQTMAIYSIPADAEPVERTILMEEMTSELDPLAPVADSLYREAVQQCDDVIWVKHHIDVGTRKDGNPWDTFGSADDRQYIRFYEGYPGQNVDFTPALSFDRNHFQNMREAAGICYFIEDDYEADVMLGLCRQVPCYLNIGTQLDYDEATRQLGVEVNASSVLSQMIHQEDLHLTVYVVEDSLRSTLQKTNATSVGLLNPDGTYTQNGVIRSFVNGVWGESVTLENNGTDFGFSRQYSVQIPEEWNVRNLRVVAFVHNYNIDAQYGDQTVYNATQGFVYAPAGLDCITTADEDTDCIYSIDGRRLASGHTLRSGFYVVRHGNEAKRILIR